MQRAQGRARIALEADGGRGRLAALHQSGCLKLRLPRVPAGRPREAVLINTAGGLTGGDRLDVAVEVGAGARLAVATQTAERLYRSAGEGARIAATLCVGKGGRLAWLPQETIAFDGSSLRRTLDVDLAPDARFLAVEQLVLGRAAMGERVTRLDYSDRWRVRIGGRLAHAEALRLGESAIGAWFERSPVLLGRRALATALYVAPDATERVAEARERLGPDGAVDAYASPARLVARVVAGDGLALRRRLAPLLSYLNGEAMGLGCAPNGHAEAMPAVWSL